MDSNSNSLLNVSNKSCQLFFDYSLTEFPRFTINSDTDDYQFNLGEYTQRLLNKSSISQISQNKLNTQSSFILNNNNKQDEGFYYTNLSNSKKENFNQFLKVINSIIQFIKKYEELKEQLVKYKDISIYTIFNMFTNKDKITKKEFKEKLKEKFNLYISTEDIDLLYYYYDITKDDKLSLNEFALILLPRKIEYAKILSSHKVYTNINNISVIKDLLSFLFDSLRNNQILRKNLFCIPTFNCYDCFELIKAEYDNVIYKKNLNIYLKKNGIYLTQFDLNCLFYDINTNADDMITFNEFVKFLMPYKNLIDK